MPLLLFLLWFVLFILSTYIILSFSLMTSASLKKQSVTNSYAEAMETHSRELDAVQRLELRSHLLTLPFAGFARCLADLLTATGYRDVSLSGRTQWKGRNQGGGYDLEGIWETPLSRRKMVVQVKQFGPHQRVYQRTIDELRGVALRAGAQEAVLLTTGPLSGIVREQGSSSLPVRCVEGGELLDLLTHFRVGVTESKGKLVVTRDYFDGLEQRYFSYRWGSHRPTPETGDHRTVRGADDPRQEQEPSMAASQPAFRKATLTLVFPARLTLTKRTKADNSKPNSFRD